MEGLPQELLDRFDAAAASWPEYVAYVRACAIMCVLIGGTLFVAGWPLALLMYKKGMEELSLIPIFIGAVIGLPLALFNIMPIMYPTAAAINALVSK